MNVEDYIPHRGPARMIDRLVEVDAEHVVAEADVPARGRLVRDGAMPAWAAIELMAQAVAAWAGERACRDGRAPPLGFLVSVRRCDMTRADVPAGTTLRIEAHCDFIGANGLGTFGCAVYEEAELVARAELSVFEPPDAALYLAGVAPGADAEATP